MVTKFSIGSRLSLKPLTLWDNKAAAYCWVEGSSTSSTSSWNELEPADDARSRTGGAAPSWRRPEKGEAIFFVPQS